MKVDAKLRAVGGAEVAAAVTALEHDGYDGVWTAESAHDPFLPLPVAAQHCARMQLGTAIAVAFARSPMTLAYTAHDLQVYCAGRFVLGLGSQVEPHVRRRFGMPWSAPAARMREYVLALRAIWDAWRTGGPLAFEGEIYRHTLMTPFFTPDALPFPPPPVHLAAVGERMTEVAGEVADGLIAHSFTTPGYLADRTLPALDRGAARAGRPDRAVEISLPCLVATGATAEQLADAVTATRRQVAFYASTPAYRAVLDHHGWGALGAELHALSRTDDPARWEAMTTLVPDEVLDAFAVVATPDELGRAVVRRFGGLVDRISFATPHPTGRTDLCSALAGVRAASAAEAAP